MLSQITCAYSTQEKKHKMHTCGVKSQQHSVLLAYKTRNTNVIFSVDMV